MNAQRPVPLRPDYRAAARRAVRSIARACISTMQRNPQQHARTWDDPDALLITRAASEPASIADHPTLAAVSVAFLSALTAVSAGAHVLGRAIQLNFDSSAEIKVPNLVVPMMTFIAEGGAYPVYAGLVTAGASLTPSKMGGIILLTAEMIQGSNSQQLMETALVEAAGLSLDAVLFSTDAAVVGLKPAGLLNGVAATPAAPAGPDAMRTDIATICGKVARTTAGEIVIVAAPEQAEAIPVRDIRHDVLASSALPAGTVIAIGLQGIVRALAGVPMVEEARKGGTLQMNTTPVEDGGLGNPVRDIYQTDTSGLKLRWPLSWARRSPGCIAWAQAVNW